ncbi:MAG: histidine--tRNA ligase [Ruminococcaceae bacterium]|nr:histidine--tRNA ligase [Oscillospiraceae bacterium]
MSDLARNIKGAFDYLPERQRVRRDITKILTECFEKYGFSPVETPIINYLDLLASKYAGGAEILKEVYSLTDQGGRDLALRYDLTVPLCKLVAMNPQLTMPFKRYEIGHVFRNGPVKSGRNREFTQCDVDMAGADSLTAEVEFLTMTVEVFQRLELPIRIELSSRKLLSGIILLAGIPEELTAAVITSVDKLKKIGRKGVADELSETGIAPERLERLFDLFAMPFDQLCAEAGEGNDLLNAGIADLKELYGMLDAAGITNSIVYAPHLARGLDIYTGCVWEVFMTEGGVTSSIGAGGRYDNIIGKLSGGRDIPAVGMTFGLDVIYAVLIERGQANKGTETELFIVPMGTENASVALAMGLRREGLRVTLETVKRKMKKSLDYANKENIPYVIILGGNEVEAGRITVKDMANHTSEEFDISDYAGMIAYIRK